MLEPIAFLSYTTFDNAHDEDAIAWFCERLSGEVRMQTGKSFPIFRDRKDIRWGQNWKERIEQGIDAATFLQVFKGRSAEFNSFNQASFHLIWIHTV